MQRIEIVETLRAHRAELRAAGIVHLRLHGSVARGEASPDSDVDLIAEFEPGRRLTLLDMVKIENRLQDLLGVNVDLSPSTTLKEAVRQRAEQEAVLAF
jgi:predicted nucleotidyltransferase